MKKTLILIAFMIFSLSAFCQEINERFWERVDSLVETQTEYREVKKNIKKDPEAIFYSKRIITDSIDNKAGKAIRNIVKYDIGYYIGCPDGFIVCYTILYSINSNKVINVFKSSN